MDLSATRDLTIILRPTAGFDEASLTALANSLTEATGLVTRIGDPFDLDPDDCDRRRGQFPASLVVSRLPDVPEDEVLLLVTDVDLYSSGLNFVYGKSEPERRRAVVSAFRPRSEFLGRAPSPEQVEHRLLIEALHEVGRLLGLERCQEASCPMFYSFNLYDTDRKTTAFCEGCASQLE